MSQSGSPPVVDPTPMAFPPEAGADLTTLLHQALACTVEWPIIFVAMIVALDAYTDVVAERLAGRECGTACTMTS